MAAFWRSRFGRALSAWIVVALAFELGITRVLEVLGKGMALVWLALLVLAPLSLMIWALKRVTQKTGTWRGAGAVVATWISVAAAGFPLSRASVYLNFWSHRAAYDAVVADFRAGRLNPGPGRRHGVEYNATASGYISFAWYWDFDIGQGIAYDEANCPPRPPPAPPPPTPAAGPGEPDPPTIKNAGTFHADEYRLGGHYCFFSIP